MSNLHDYLSQNGITQREFATALGVDQSVVSRLTRNKINPRLSLAVKIERETNGAVPAESWVSADMKKAG